MQITDRQYPYPVLNFYNNDFDLGSYQVYIKFLESNSEEIVLDIGFDLNCDVLNELIMSEKASFAIHLECGRTRYRKVLKAKHDILVTIKSKDISGELEVLPLILANETIKNYKSDDFIEDFEGEEFDIAKGSILGIAEQRKIVIEKEGDNLQSLPSIFSIRKKEKNENGMDWSDNGDKVIISLSEDKYKAYKVVAMNKRLVAMTSVLIIVPVLVEILADLKRDETAFDGATWSIVLKNRIDKLGIDLESGNLVEIAHKILDGALEESFETIKALLEEE